METTTKLTVVVGGRDAGGGSLLASLEDQVHSLKEALGPRSLIKDLAEVGLVGGGAVAGLSFIGSTLSEITSKASDLAQEFREGKIGIEGMAEQFALSVPVVGGFIGTFHNLFETISGARAEAEKLAATMAEAQRQKDLAEESGQNSILNQFGAFGSLDAADTINEGLRSGAAAQRTANSPAPLPALATQVKAVYDSLGKSFGDLNKAFDRIPGQASLHETLARTLAQMKHPEEFAAFTAEFPFEDSSRAVMPKLVEFWVSAIDSISASAASALKSQPFSAALLPFPGGIFANHPNPPDQDQATDPYGNEPDLAREAQVAAYRRSAAQTVLGDLLQNAETMSRDRARLGGIGFLSGQIGPGVLGVGGAAAQGEDDTSKEMLAEIKRLRTEADSRDEEQKQILIDIATPVKKFLTDLQIKSIFEP